MGLRSLRGFPTNRRRVASDADIDVVEQKSRTVESDGRGLQENDNPTEAFLSIVKNDGISSCKGILVHPDWIITAGRCADGALTITAWIGVNNTSYLPDDYTTADSDVERHIITHADINMSPGHDSTKPDGEFAMLHLNVASNKTAALAKSDFQALGRYRLFDYWWNFLHWEWSDDCWVYADGFGGGWCNTCSLQYYTCLVIGSDHGNV